MAKHDSRFWDSYLIRLGIGIITVIAGAAVAAIASLYFFGYNPPVGPMGLWALLGIFLAFVLILVGVGQTIVRRRRVL